jgi:hypothetical protein
MCNLNSSLHTVQSLNRITFFVGTSAIEVAYESGEVFANNTGLAINSGASWILYRYVA